MQQRYKRCMLGVLGLVVRHRCTVHAQEGSKTLKLSKQALHCCWRAASAASSTLAGSHAPKSCICCACVRMNMCLYVACLRPSAFGGWKSHITTGWIRASAACTRRIMSHELCHMHHVTCVMPWWQLRPAAHRHHSTSHAALPASSALYHTEVQPDIL